MRISGKAVKIFFASLLLSSFLAAECGAVNIIDWIMYKEATLKTGARVLVHRITGRVGYYWQTGYRWGDAEYDLEAGGSWKVPVPALKARLQQQYNNKDR